VPRQRFIWPDLWSNPTFGRLSELEKVLYIGMFSMADDEGRIRAEPTFLAATVLPNTKVGVTRARRARNAVVAAFDHVRLYEIDGAEYIALLNWPDWQKPKYPSPSKLPAPPEDSGNGSGNDSRNDSGSDSRNDSPMGREGLGLEDLKQTPPNPNPVVDAARAPEEQEADPNDTASQDVLVETVRAVAAGEAHVVKDLSVL